MLAFELRPQRAERQIERLEGLRAHGLARLSVGTRGAARDWRGVFAGATLTPGATHRTGHIVVDFAVMHALDTGVALAEGRATVHFDVIGPVRDVSATFVGTLGKSAPQPQDSA